MSDAPQPAPRRLPALLLITFLIGTCSAATSLERARGVWTAEHTTDSAQKYIDALLQGLTQGSVPQAAQHALDDLRTQSAQLALTHRPLKAALAVTGIAVGLLLAWSVASTLRQRPFGISWLRRAVGVAMLFELMQMAAGAKMDLEQARLLAKFAPQIVRASNPPPTVATLLEDPPSAFRFLLAVPPLVAGALKLAVLAYLFVLLRRLLRSAAQASRAPEP